MLVGTKNGNVNVGEVEKSYKDDVQSLPTCISSLTPLCASMQFMHIVQTALRLVIITVASFA